MEAEDSEPVEETASGEVTTVARSVLSAYFDSLAATEGFADIAPKLRAVVLDQGQFNEIAIKAAMFPDGS